MGLLLFYAKLGWVGGPGPARRRLSRISVDAGHRPAAASTAAIAGRVGGVPRTPSPPRSCRPSLLGYFSLAYISRMTRSFMLEQLRAGIRRRRAGQGPVASARVDLAPCAAQRRWCRCSPSIALSYARPARRRGADRDGLRLAGPRPLHHQLAAERRHERGARRHARGRRRLRRRSTCSPTCSTGCSIRGRADDGADAPPTGAPGCSTDRAAARGRRRGSARPIAAGCAFARNPLAVVGPRASSLLLVLVAVFAPLLAPHVADRAGPRPSACMPPSAGALVRHRRARPRHLQPHRLRRAHHAARSSCWSR